MPASVYYSLMTPTNAPTGTTIITSSPQFVIWQSASSSTSTWTTAPTVLSTASDSYWSAEVISQWRRAGREAAEQLARWTDPGPDSFVATAPRIIRPHAEREALWVTEIQREQARLAVERQAENQEARRTATLRAHDLLLEQLTPAQRDTFTRNGWFVVTGGRTGRQYRINGNRGVQGNIDVIGERHRLCAHCDLSTIPLGDHLVAQKLMLEFDEMEFLRIANRHAA